MSYPGYIDDMYKSQIDEYNNKGENLKYTDIKIHDMSSEQIRKELYLLSHGIYFNPMLKGWNEIFNDVLHKRRFNKLNKIINNINAW